MAFDGVPYDGATPIFPHAYSLGGPATPSFLADALRIAYYFARAPMPICQHTTRYLQRESIMNSYVFFSTSYANLYKLSEVSVPDHVTHLAYNGRILVQPTKEDTVYWRIKATADGGGSPDTETEHSQQIEGHFVGHDMIRGNIFQLAQRHGAATANDIAFTAASALRIAGSVELSNISPPDDVVIELQAHTTNGAGTGTRLLPLEVAFWWETRG